MGFCEQCGARLSPGVRFCEECGAVVEETELQGAAGSKSIALDEDYVLGSDWRNRFCHDSKGQEVGLIVTRESELLKEVSSDVADLRCLISDYVHQAAKRNVSYYYLDLDRWEDYQGDGDACSVVEVLQEVVENICAKYLWILGSERVIDVARWENEAQDQDDDVESDWCYCALNCESPWDGLADDADGLIRVGRLPTYPGESFDEFASYFRHVSASAGKLNHTLAYGLSAQVWAEESNAEFKAISSGHVDVSPTVTRNVVKGRLGSETNLLYFNLHGSDQTKFWYGQEGGSYPEAFEPIVLEGMNRPYIVGVEACYGARWTGGLKPKDSILLTALQNRCLAMLASSRIAFGTCRPAGSCADVVVGQFMKFVAKGYTVGDAYIEGIKALCFGDEEPDDAEIKTLAEFALYGDPSLSIGVNHSKNVVSGWKPHITMPDVRHAVSMSLTQVDNRIESMIDDLVQHQLFPGLGDVILRSSDQKVFKMSSGMNQKMYCMDSGGWKTVAKVYFDDQGIVHKAIISK